MLSYSGRTGCLLPTVNHNLTAAPLAVRVPVSSRLLATGMYLLLHVYGEQLPVTAVSVGYVLLRQILNRAGQLFWS